FSTALLSLFIILLFGSFSSPVSDSDSFSFENDHAGMMLPIESSWVDSVYNTLSLQERIGQLFMVSAYSDKGQEHHQELLELIKDYNIGGLIFFQGNPEKQAKRTNIYQNYSEVPLMIGMDAEWGLGMRLDSTINYPRQMALGAIQNDSLIYRMGVDIGEQLRRMGVQINFAPVVDINNNPANPVIGSRSFGENKRNVARKGIAYMNGLQDKRVLAVAKHFPGHGDTDTDSHKALPVIDHDSLRLDSLELFPFKRLISNGVGGIMTAHLNIPSLIEENNRPTTLSKNVVTHLLRNSLLFSGLVFTDALNMQGVTNHFDPGEIEYEALKAGNDVLLYPQDIPKAISYIKKEIRRGNLSEKTINESCRRVLAFKYWAGLDSYSSKIEQQKEVVSSDSLYDDINKPEYKALLQELRESSLVMLENKNEILPVKNLQDTDIAGLVLGSDGKTPFLETLDHYKEVDHFFKNDPSFSQGMLETLSQYDLVLAGITNTHQSKTNNYGLKQGYYSFLDSLSSRTNVVLVHFANPYGLSLLPEEHNFDGLVVGFNDDSLTQHVAAQSVFGGNTMEGKLPVSVENRYAENEGKKIKNKIRLKYSLPESAGMSSQKLEKVDSILQAAIDSMATPGGQIVVARDGKVVFNKAFGHHTYLKRKPIEWSNVYDVASLTKIFATLPILMDLSEAEKVNIDSSLAKYLPHLDTTNKEDVILKDVLTHQARLKSWIPFYQSTIEPLSPDKDLLNNNFTEEYPYKLGNGSYMVKNFKFREGIFSQKKHRNFDIEVADGLFMNNAYIDTIYKQIDQSDLREEKEYKYSDLGYYYLYRLIERIGDHPLEKLVNENFYESLGMNRTGFLPLNLFPKHEIVPTENDMVFRKQLLQGYVHDPGAAMLGGVCGHAGLFSNANDLTKMMQMYLNEGSYGGMEYFSNATIGMFTEAPFKDENDNRRAIGFDKPVTEKDEPGPSYNGVSSESFGHTGFTGTISWADPKEDLIYIFLSNRIHPDQYNVKLIKSDIRTNIQKAIYEAIE
ncbi:MAG: glycoside hydrolase family 3 N-terminal domain-containing protein, partial [Bacteroidota bacterium]